MADKRKTHIKVKNKAVCGVKRKKRKLQFVTDEKEATCGNCLRAVAK